MTDNFTPNPEQLALLPKLTGCDINGLGETDIRRPTPIYWHDPERIAHGDLQAWFYKFGPAPEVRPIREETMKVMAAPLSEIAPAKPDWTPEQWSENIKAAALDREADLVGIARIKPEWVFEGFDVKEKWIVVLGLAMDFDEICDAPGPRTQVEVQTQYGRGARASHKLASWVQEQGWEAKFHGGPRAGPMLIVPAALEAGFGELGKHGSIINRQYGSSLRLAYVLTDAPLIPDTPDDIGADGFCTSCQLCSRGCPVDAVSTTKEMVRGVEKWFINFDKCILYFNENNGCAVCLAKCPWNKKGTAPRLAEKLTKRQSSS
jgi:ferredoxin